MQNYKGVLRANILNDCGSEIIWAAVYVGTYTTNTLPEYQVKGYVAELSACQRFLQRFRTFDLRKTYCEEFRPAMRMTTQGTVFHFNLEGIGVTYYFASAEL